MNDGAVLVAGEHDGGSELVGHLVPGDGWDEEQEPVEEGGEEAADGDHDAQVAAVARRPGLALGGALQPVPRRGHAVRQRPGHQGSQERRHRRYHRDRPDLAGAQAHCHHVQR